MILLPSSDPMPQQAWLHMAALNPRSCVKLHSCDTAPKHMNATCLHVAQLLLMPNASLHVSCLLVQESLSKAEAAGASLQEQLTAVEAQLATRGAELVDVKGQLEGKEAELQKANGQIEERDSKVGEGQR